MSASNFKVGTRMVLAFSILAAMLMIIAGIGATRLQSLNSEVTLLSKDRVPKLVKAAEWDHSLLQSARHSRNLLILDGRDKLKAEIDSLLEQRSTRGEIIKFLDERVTDSQGRATLKILQEQRAKYSASEQRFIDLVQAEKVADAKALLLAETRPLQLDYLKGINAFAETQKELVSAQAESASHTYESSLLMLIVLSAVGLVAACVLAFLVGRSITRPLATAVDTANRISKGDLTVQALASGKDEMAQLLRALATMTQNLRSVVGGVRTSADSVATASQQIADGNADLSARTEEQASSLQETASSIEQLAGAVKQNADNASQGNQLAQNASTVAVRGGDVVEQVVGTMREINDSSKKIADIIGVIDGIAFQTNILALNAAVEAARAGEQGRGFAVVAAEVRSLAQRSADAAREIKTLITASVERVEAGTALVDQAGSTMREIVTSIQRVTDIMGEITAASNEQSVGIAQVNDAVSQMDQVTQQNAALVEEASAAAVSLREQAAQLVEAVSVFRVSGEQPAPKTVAARAVHHNAPVERRLPDRAKNAARIEPKLTAQSAASSVKQEISSLRVTGTNGSWQTF